jgi:hypothetical protein
MYSMLDGLHQAAACGFLGAAVLSIRVSGMLMVVKAFLLVPVPVPAAFVYLRTTGQHL